MLSRRRFLRLAAAAGIGLALPRRLTDSHVFASAQIPQTPLSGKTIPRFVEPLPVFGSSIGLEQGQVNAPRVTGTDITVSMNEVQQKVLPASFYANLLDKDLQKGTWVWAYNVGNTIPLYPGITVEAQRGVATNITYVNNLPVSGSKGLEYVTTDQSIHWANPMNLPMDDPDRMMPYSGPPPVVAHLHGAEVASFFDGGPDEWFTPDGRHGPGYSTYTSADPNAAIYHYVNEQEAATLWFHDHALGATRLNVYRGLAAFYLLRDGFDTGLENNPLGLPAGPYEREIAIQDRQFDVNGQWLFPDSGEDEGLNGPPPNPYIHPFWNPEFFGDVMVVNGKSWPYFNVEPRRYRFRLLDGCNARFLELRLMNRDTHSAGPSFWVIGTDGGLLDKPVQLNDPTVPADKAPRLFMAPGERYDIIIDFSGFAGQTLTLVNSAKTPYPAGIVPNSETTGEVMQFRVVLDPRGPDTSFNPANGMPLRKSGSMAPIIRLANPDKGTLAAGVSPHVNRLLTLVEAEGPGGPVEVLVNNTGWEGKRETTVGGVEQMIPIPGAIPDDHGNYLTETPRVGSTEVWEIVNLTMDAHPIHLHLTQFQLINRQSFNLTQYKAKYESLFPAGDFGGVTNDDHWSFDIFYPGGVLIPGYGPPLAIDGSDPLSAGKPGGNPDVTPYLQGKPTPPKPEEAGWKDTVKMFPGQVSRIAVRFAPQDTALNGVQPGDNLYGFDPTIGPGYVWHCHIVDHEDNEMMRPYHPIP